MPLFRHLYSGGGNVIPAGITAMEARYSGREIGRRRVIRSMPSVRREERLSISAVCLVAEPTTNSAGAISTSFAHGAHAFQATFSVDASSQFGSRTTRALAYGLTAHTGITRDEKCRCPAGALAS